MFFLDVKTVIFFKYVNVASCIKEKLLSSFLFVISALNFAGHCSSEVFDAI